MLAAKIIAVLSAALLASAGAVNGTWSPNFISITTYLFDADLDARAAASSKCQASTTTITSTRDLHVSLDAADEKLHETEVVGKGDASRAQSI